jgi:uncharacterized protein (TIGR03067 family)
MHFRHASLLLLAALPLTATAQQPKLKPLSEILTPAQTLPGLWVQTKPGGEETMTFDSSGRLVMARGNYEKMECTWKIDTSATPWKLDITIKGKEGTGTIYTVFDFPEKDQLRFVAPVIHADKRPGADALQKSPLLLTRVPLEPHAGIHQAVQAHLKGFAGTWQGTTNGSKGTVTFTADGTYTTTEGSDTDKGRFRIDVSKVPCKIDMISTEGNGARFGLYEMKDGTLRFSSAKRTAAERPGDLDKVTEFVKKK